MQISKDLLPLIVLWTTSFHLTSHNCYFGSGNVSRESVIFGFKRTVLWNLMKLKTGTVRTVFIIVTIQAYFFSSFDSEHSLDPLFY